MNNGDPRRNTGKTVPIKSYGSVIELHRLGFVEANDPLALPPIVGEPAVVVARGGLRLGVISKVGRTITYVDVATPTSPDLITTGRIGGRFNENNGWLKSSVPYTPCGDEYGSNERYLRRCQLTRGHAGYHRCLPVHPRQTYDEVWRSPS